MMNTNNNQLLLAAYAAKESILRNLVESTNGELSQFTKLTFPTNDWFKWINQGIGNSLDGYFTKIGEFSHSPNQSGLGVAVFSLVTKLAPGGLEFEHSATTVAGSYVRVKDGHLSAHTHTLFSTVGKKGSVTATALPDFGQLFCFNPGGDLLPSIMKPAYQHPSKRCEVGQMIEDARVAAQKHAEEELAPKLDSDYAHWNINFSDYLLSNGDNSVVAEEWESTISTLKQRLTTAGYDGRGYIQLVFVCNISSLTWKPPVWNEETDEKYPYNMLYFNAPAFVVYARLVPPEADSQSRDALGLKRTMNFFKTEGHKISGNSQINELVENLEFSESIRPTTVEQTECMVIDLAGYIGNIGNPTLVELVRAKTGKGFDNQATKAEVLEALEGVVITKEDIIAAYRVVEAHPTKEDRKTARFITKEFGNTAEGTNTQAPQNNTNPNSTTTNAVITTNKPGVTRETVLKALYSKVMSEKQFMALPTQQKGFIFFKLARVANDTVTPAAYKAYFNTPQVKEGYLCGYSLADIFAGINKAPASFGATIAQLLAGKWWVQLNLSANPVVVPAEPPTVAPDVTPTEEIPQIKARTLGKQSVTTEVSVEVPDVTPTEEIPQIKARTLGKQSVTTEVSVEVPDATPTEDIPQIKARTLGKQSVTTESPVKAPDIASVEVPNDNKNHTGSESGNPQPWLGVQSGRKRAPGIVNLD